MMQSSQSSQSSQSRSGADRTITVFGAYGHTGQFVVAELLRRGWTPILSGRDADRLRTLAERHPGLEVRPASIDDAATLDRALTGSSAVINCAGSFLDTAAPVMEAALRARIHYLDLAAEQAAALAAFEEFSGAACTAGIAIIPAMAFYGGLTDLLATAAMGDWMDADDIRIAVALDSWLPTRGTRLTGERNTAKRLVVSEGRLQPLADPPPTRTWQFPPPFGEQEVAALTLSEIVTISRHLRVPEVHAYMNLEPLRHLRDPDTPAPTAADERGRSVQVFMMDVIVRRGDEQRRATAQGRDIYAVSAPLVVEAAVRVLEGAVAPGVFAPGELFDAREFLASLRPQDVVIEIA